MKGVPQHWRSPLPHFWIGRKTNILPQLLESIEYRENEAETIAPRRFKPGELTAALKLYITLVLMAHDEKQERNAGKGCVKTTYEEFILYLKLSRPMVARGLRILEDFGAIERIGIKPLIYRVRGLDGSITAEWQGYAWLPKGHLFGDRRRNSAKPIMLANYPIRGASAAHGLALYLLLVSVTQRNSNVSLITYSKMNERLGLTNHQLRRAIDLLVNQELIWVLRVTTQEAFEALGLAVPEVVLKGAPNAYLIRGLRGRSYNGRVNTLDDYYELAKGNQGL